MLSRDLLPGVPLVESPFFEIDAPAALDGETLRVARDLNRDGFAVIDFPDLPSDAEIEALKRDLHPRYDWAHWNAGGGGGPRLQDAWKDLPTVRAIAASPRLLELLSEIYGRRAIPFQTLNFPVGTEQAPHSDHVHFNSVPDRFMCGVWLALEDIDLDNGPLEYFPGSHTWTTFQNEHVGVPMERIAPGYPEYRRFETLWTAMAKAKGIERRTFTARKGQALIWCANLVHGGAAHRDRARTRWSQVTHYVFENCVYTTPLENDVYRGRIVFRDIVDIATGERVSGSVNGAPVGRGFRLGVEALKLARAARGWLGGAKG